MVWHMKTRALVSWNVRRIRVERGISQEKLACGAGIDRSYMSGLERQSKNPTIDLLERIADSLGVHLSELFVQPPKGTRIPTSSNGRKPERPQRRKKQLRSVQVR
ncbi:transcriptional regulator protein [Bradyrhizobium elkanii USDA 61]|jgi:transcriptional regulator with XRE-family HTH domain|nr:transcriptional regulator protein [Bradyrhizobium elkanii USDA 61]